MRYRLFSTKINATSMTAARQRTRQVGNLFGLETLQRTRLITAVSELARNTVQYAGSGTLAFLFDTRSPILREQCLVAEISDKGPGIPDLDRLLKALDSKAADAGAGAGIAGARRLVDHLSIHTPKEGGTVVTLEMLLPRGTKSLTVNDINLRVNDLVANGTGSPVEELEQQNREMLYALEELQQKQFSLQLADERKNEFLAMLAHELRNPLATLTMSLELLRRKLDLTPAELALRREIMTRQTDQLQRLVDDLLDVARVTKGKVDLHRVPSEVNGLVRSALEMVSAAITEKEHKVTFHAAPNDLWIYGDPARLLQVLGNILHNAARYTPTNGEIGICVRTLERNVEVEISDNGVGISAEMLPQVFGLFVQASQPASGGLGVGLTLAERLLHDHGGQLRVKSEGAGKGSQFTVSLPLMADSAS
ncbi:MAG: sensor histidine kinase [Pseudomonadota bacterium]